MQHTTTIRWPGELNVLQLKKTQKTDKTQSSKENTFINLTTHALQVA